MISYFSTSRRETHLTVSGWEDESMIRQTSFDLQRNDMRSLWFLHKRRRRNENGRRCLTLLLLVEVKKLGRMSDRSDWASSNFSSMTGVVYDRWKSIFDFEGNVEKKRTSKKMQDRVEGVMEKEAESWRGKYERERREKRYFSFHKCLQVTTRANDLVSPTEKWRDL